MIRRRVPAHVRDLQAGPRREPDDPAAEQAEALVQAVLLARVEEELEPEADAQAGLARGDGLLEGVAQPGPAQLGDGVGEGPDAGQDHLRGRADAVRVAADLGRVADGLDRLLDAPEVAHPVVDDDDHAPRSLRPIRPVRQARS